MPFSFRPSRDYGSDWAAYFFQYTHDLAAFADDTEPEIDAGGHITLLEPFASVPVEKAPKAIRGHIGWLPDREVEVITCKVERGAVYTKTGENAGQVRYQPKVMKWWQWVTTDKRYPVVMASYTDTSLDFAKLAVENRPVVIVQNVTTLKNLLKGATNDGEQEVST